MIKSMTGFGRAEVLDKDKKITVELKAVNHRFLDVSIKMPKKLNFFDASVRTLLKEYMERGKIDIFITCEDYSENSTGLRYNRDMAAAYLKYLREMAEDFGLEDDITAARLSRYPEIFSLEDQNTDDRALWDILERALRKALDQLVEARFREGEALKADLLGKLSDMREHVIYIEERTPEITKEYKARLIEKIKELSEDISIDESRLLTETAIYADKVCIDEELVRLKSHIDSMVKTLEKGGSVGRKLDFIAQEMNREANTILSKSNDLMTSERGIEIKTTIEKIREQIQNLE